MKSAIIKHKYGNASDSPGQYDADCCGRQAVTAQWLFEHPDAHGYIWHKSEFDCWTSITGVDALTNGSKIILEYGSTGEKIVDHTYQVFVQKNDIPIEIRARLKTGGFYPKAKYPAA